MACGTIGPNSVTTDRAAAERPVRGDAAKIDAVLERSRVAHKRRMFVK